ncbi:hypothetical protein [Halorussus halophilus]|uniref:hypothetical protein n=1 Tax=Halorussus halophilus TaxID=2650975 RepID=UPI0013015784|nr:hypothetical protein [Halorussus halophilus]
MKLATKSITKYVGSNGSNYFNFDAVTADNLLSCEVIVRPNRSGYYHVSHGPNASEGFRYETKFTNDGWFEVDVYEISGYGEDVEVRCLYLAGSGA